jgi:glycosyltransferase involved in cell wall biosynthesis
MKLTNKFIIVVPVHNAKNLIESCLASLISQSFDDLGIIIRDDISMDGTDDVIRKFLGVEGNEAQIKFNGKDIIFIANNRKLYPIGNTYDSVMNYVDNKNAIIGVVDGDDALISAKAVQTVYDVYESDPNKWLVWSQHMNQDGTTGQSTPLPPDSVIYQSRNYWAVSHFRTSRIGLFYKLDANDLKDPFVENSYYTYAGDAAFLFAFCEMAGNEHSQFIPQKLYLYNNNLPTNEHNKDVNSAIKYGTYIRQQGKKYTKLDSLTI